jgi:hypothetical protein
LEGQFRDMQDRPFPVATGKVIAPLF